MIFSRAVLSERVRAYVARTVLTMVAVALLATSGTAQQVFQDIADKAFIDEVTLRSFFTPQDYTINFELRNAGPGGSLRLAGVSNNFVLGSTPTASSQIVYSLNACAFTAPSSALRSSLTITAIAGTADVGFVDENGALIRNSNLQPINSFFIPQGLVNFIANPSCLPATVISTYSNNDISNSILSASFINLPTNIISSIVPTISTAEAMAFRNALLDGTVPFIALDPACVRRCGL
eukprot:jgi/Ulvmu1/5696/UM024_0043.1